MGISSNWLHPSWNPTGSVNVSRPPLSDPRMQGDSQPRFMPGIGKPKGGYGAPAPDGPIIGVFGDAFNGMGGVGGVGGGGRSGGGGGGLPSFHSDPQMTMAEKRARGMLMGNNHGGLTRNPLAAAFGKLMDRSDYATPRIGSEALAPPDELPQGYADGGFPVPGEPALVGERGPEIIIPQVPTQVVPMAEGFYNPEADEPLPMRPFFAAPRGVAGTIAQGADAARRMGGPLAPGEAANNNPEAVVQIPNADRSMRGMFGEVPYPTRDGVPLNDPSQKWKPGGLPTSDLSVDMGEIMRNQLKSGNPGMVGNALGLMQHGTQAANAQDFHRDTMQENRNLYNQSVQDVNAWRHNDAEAKRAAAMAEHSGMATAYETAKMLPDGAAAAVAGMTNPAAAKGFIAAMVKAQSKTMDESVKAAGAREALRWLASDPKSGIDRKMAEDMLQHGTAAGIMGFLKDRVKPKDVGQVGLQPVPGVPGAVVPISPGGKQIPPDQVLRQSGQAPQSVDVPSFHVPFSGDTPAMRVTSPGDQKLEPYFPKTQHAGNVQLHDFGAAGAPDWRERDPATGTWRKIQRHEDVKPGTAVPAAPPAPLNTNDFISGALKKGAPAPAPRAAAAPPPPAQEETLQQVHERMSKAFR